MGQSTLAADPAMRGGAAELRQLHALLIRMCDPSHGRVSFALSVLARWACDIPFRSGTVVLRALCEVLQPCRSGPDCLHSAATGSDAERNLRTVRMRSLGTAPVRRPGRTRCRWYLRSSPTAAR